MWTKKARGMKALVTVSAVAGSAACNLISGADGIDFTGPPAGGGAEEDGGGCEEPEGSTAVACADGHMAVGARVHGGAWLDQFNVICAPILADGAPGYPLLDSNSVGGPGGIPDEELCPPAEVIVAFKFSYPTDGSPTHVYQVSIACQTPSAWTSTGEHDGFSRFFGGNTATSGESSLTAPPGHAISRIYADSGSGEYVDVFRDICTVALP